MAELQTDQANPTGEDVPVTYNDAFPPLPDTFGVAAEKRGPALRSSKQIITSMMHIPFEERKYKDTNDAAVYARQQDAQTRACQTIMHETNVKLELTATRAGQLTVVLTGKADSIAKAKRMVATELQTRASNEVAIPREHFGFILGRNRIRIKVLEEQTNTEIHVPPVSGSSNLIRVTGTRDGVRAACAELRKWSDEREKLAEERLQIERELHPFIAGPGNELIHQLEANHNIRIRLPPPRRAGAETAPTPRDNEIIVSGERDEVAVVKAIIMKIVESKRGKIQAIPVKISKQQHRYVIGRNGANVAEIQRVTGVIVEVPPADSPVDLITLRGEPAQLGRAVTLVYEKANSVVRVVLPADTWLHRHVIGREGVKLNELLAAAGVNRDRVRVEFESDKEHDSSAPGRVIIEGDPTDCELVRIRIDSYLNELRTTLTCREIRVETRLIKHLIGKKGSTINKIKNETGCQIVVPSEHEHEAIAVIRIEGEPRAVEKARAELDEIHRRIQNETQKDVEIDQKLHRQVIGAKGERISEIRSKFPEVQVTFPEPGRRSDLVQLRGPRADVEGCAKQLLKCAQEIAERSYESTMHIPKDFVRYVVGKGGATLNKLREENDVRIILPEETPGAENDNVSMVFIGRRKNVDAAKKAIENIVKDVAKIREVRVQVTPSVLNAMVQNTKLIKQLREECHPATVRFPDAAPKAAESSSIVLRGVDKEVEIAKQKALKLIEEIRENSFVDSVIVRPEFHRYLVGRNYVNIKRYREQFGVRVVVPVANRPVSAAAVADEETSTPTPETVATDAEERSRVTLVGKQADVVRVKADLERVVRELENTLETTLEIDAKWHKRFLQRSGELIRQMSEELGNVLISFPRLPSPKHTAKKEKQKEAEEATDGTQQQQPLTTVRIKGPRDCVAEAVTRLKDQVAEWENEVTSECIIPHRFFSSMLVNRGIYVQQIAERHSVVIRFPERKQKSQTPKQSTPNHSNKKTTAGVKVETQETEANNAAETLAREPQDIDEQKDAAVEQKDTADDQKDATDDQKDAADDQKDATDDQKDVADDQKDAADDQKDGIATTSAPDGDPAADTEDGTADRIKVIGKRENVDAACEELRKLVPITDQLELSSDCLVQCRNLSMIEMRRLMQEYGVRITIVDGNVSSADEKEETTKKRVDIYGIPSRVEEVKQELTKRVEQYETWRRDQIARNARTPIEVAEKWHSNLIGRGGERIRSLQQRFNVRIVLPKRGRARDDGVAQQTQPQTQSQVNGEAETEANVDSVSTPNNDNEGDVGDKSAAADTEASAVATNGTQQDAASNYNPNEIVIVGYTERAAECVREIEKLVAEWQSLVTETIDVDARVHPRIIGSRGTRLKEIMKQFDTRITISREAAYPDRITVSGQREKVEACIDELLQIADECLQDMDYVPRSSRTLGDHAGINFVFGANGNKANGRPADAQATKQKGSTSNGTGKKGFTVVGGPWDKKSQGKSAADATGKHYENDFPAMAAGENETIAGASENGVSSGAVAPVWSGLKR